MEKIFFVLAFTIEALTSLRMDLRREYKSEFVTTISGNNNYSLLIAWQRFPVMKRTRWLSKSVGNPWYRGKCSYLS